MQLKLWDAAELLSPYVSAKFTALSRLSTAGSNYGQNGIDSSDIHQWIKSSHRSWLQKDLPCAGVTWNDDYSKPFVSESELFIARVLTGSFNEHWHHRHGQTGPFPPKNFRMCRHFVLWEAVSYTRYCCSPKIKNFVPPKTLWAGCATDWHACCRFLSRKWRLFRIRTTS